MFSEQFLRNLLFIGTVTCASVIFISCGGSGSSTPPSDPPGDPPPTSNKYNGPGSKWNVELKSDGTFVIEMYVNATATTPEFTVYGNHSTLATSGFKELVVTSVDGTGGPAVGDKAYGLEVPGYVFLLKPLEGTQIIPMLQAGNCPTENGDGNWVMLKVGNGADIKETAMAGTVNVNVDTNTITLTSKYKIDGTSITPEGAFTDVVCENGIVSFESQPGETVEMYLTNNGGAIVNTKANLHDETEFVFAFAQKTIGDFTTMPTSYVGLVFDDGAADPANKIVPVNLTCNTDTQVCSGAKVNLATDEILATGGAKITLGAADIPSDGLVLGELTDDDVPGSSGDVICMFDRNANNTGKTVGSCVGIDPVGKTGMYNVLLVSK